MTRRRIRVRTVVAAAVALIAAFVVANVANTGIRAAGYGQFWREQAARDLDGDALRLVALGDSAMVAVGALDPMQGIAGRTAAFARDLTGRPVHIQNLADGGATVASIRTAQLPLAAVEAADLVIVASSNDLEQQVPLEQYRAELDALLAHLPAERTVVSDLPLLPGRDAYQAVVAEVADRYGIARADFAAVFNGPGQRLDIFSWLPPHLNDLGYRYWFAAFRPRVEAILTR